MEAFVGKFERTEHQNYEEFLKVWVIFLFKIAILFPGAGCQHPSEKGGNDFDPNHGGAIMKSSNSLLILLDFDKI